MTRKTRKISKTSKTSKTSETSKTNKTSKTRKMSKMSKTSKTSKTNKTSKKITCSLSSGHGQDPVLPGNGIHGRLLDHFRHLHVGQPFGRRANLKKYSSHG